MKSKYFILFLLVALLLPNKATIAVTKISQKGLSDFHGIDSDNDTSLYIE